MLTLADAGFTKADWAVLVGYFVLLIGTGVFFSLRKQKNTEEYFLGGHRMPVWAVAFSILATAQSAATFTGGPESSYNKDLSYLSANIGGVLAGIVLAVFVIPAYYRKRVTTPYQLLETRFGPRGKVAASATYLIGRVFATGARHFIGAYAASLAIFGDAALIHVFAAIVIFTIFGILYTLAGGITSVIWTDVIQVCVYLGAAICAIIVLLHRIPVGFSEIFSTLLHPGPGQPSKLTIVTPGLDFSKPRLGFDLAANFTLLTAVFGFSLITLASHGADQDLVQRMLTCRSARKGSWSVISGVLIGIPAVIIFLSFGLLLWVFYRRPDIMGAAAPGYDAPLGPDVVMKFTLTELPGGLAGLMIAGLLAAGPCGINSSLNAMSSTFVGDFYKTRRPDRDEKHYLSVGRMSTIAAGIVVGAFASACIFAYDPKNTKIIDFVLGIMSFAYAGLIGVFATALFTKRGSPRSCIAAIITGFVAVTLMQPIVLRLIDNLLAWMRSILELDSDWSLAAQKIAFPWQLLIGSMLAFAVCYFGGKNATPDPVDDPQSAATPLSPQA